MSGKQNIFRVNDVDINVTDVGTGNPVLIFLHYWGGSSRTWTPVIDALSTTNRCIAIDFRGWGRSAKGAADYDLDTLARDVIGVIEELGLNDFIIVGHSMGGKVAQLVAARQPEGLQQLILIAPAPPLALRVPEEQRQGMIASYQAREGAEMVIGILSALPLSTAYREQIIADTLNGASGAKCAWPETGMTKDISKQASAIRVPVHVVVGDADNIETEAALRVAFEEVIPNTEFVVLPGVGHLAPLEAPGAVIDAIRAAQVSR